MLQRLSKLRSVLAGPDTKPAAQAVRDVVALRRAGHPSRAYVTRLLYLTDAGGPSSYLSAAELSALHRAKRRPDGWVRVYQDKTLFDEHFRSAAGPAFPMPVYLGQTRAGRLMRPDGAEASVDDDAAFAGAVAEMCAASPTGALFAKPAIANKGTGAHLVRRDAAPDAVDALRRGALKTDYLFQEAIGQHPEIDRLYPGSLNTVRIITGMAADGSRPVLSAILRLGRSGKAVDNAHAGGLFVGVDRETGQLRGPYGGPARARTLWPFGGERFDRHPDTGAPFEGFEVPHFAEAVEVARRATDRLPLLYSGWDVGIGPDGPVLIEGNPGPYLQMMEAAHGGFKTDPVWRSFLAEQGIG